MPVSTVVPPGGRTVPLRDFAADEAALDPGTGHDRGATYVVLYGADGRPASRLRGGEALSALLLTATVAGLSSSPMSDAIEAAWPHQLLRELIAGLGEPYMVVRLGYYEGDDKLPESPRRDPSEVIEVIEVAEATDPTQAGDAT